jgi:hypothetical protein
MTAAYPFNLASIFPAIFPHIHVYPALGPQVCLPKPATEAKLSTPLAVKTNYPFSLSLIYKPVYPHFCLFGDILSEIKPPLQFTTMSGRPQPSNLHLELCTSNGGWLTPISPFRLPSASLMDRLALDEEETGIALQFPTYRPAATWAAFDDKPALIESNYEVKQLSLQEHMLESPISSEPSSDSEDASSLMDSSFDDFQSQQYSLEVHGPFQDDAETVDLDELSQFLASTNIRKRGEELDAPWPSRFAFNDPLETASIPSGLLRAT